MTGYITETEICLLSAENNFQSITRERDKHPHLTPTNF
jgi:hypothetical protein